MPIRRRNQRPTKFLEIIRERIEILLDLAAQEARPHLKHSKRYLQLVRKLALRYNVRLTREQRMRFCKKCFSYWRPGANVKVRLKKKEKFVCYYCSCGRIYKFPIAEKSRTKRAL